MQEVLVALQPSVRILWSAIWDLLINNKHIWGQDTCIVIKTFLMYFTWITYLASHHNSPWYHISCWSPKHLGHTFQVDHMFHKGYIKFIWFMYFTLVTKTMQVSFIKLVRYFTRSTYLMQITWFILSTYYRLVAHIMRVTYFMWLSYLLWFMFRRPGRSQGLLYKHLRE